MLKKTSTIIAEEDIGVNDCVIIHIPLVDRPNKVTMTNLLGIIVNIKSSPSSSAAAAAAGLKLNERLYDIATKHGKIRPMLCRNQFDLCRRRDLFSNLVVNKISIISLRHAVMKEAKVNGLATIKKCKCTNKCDTNRCICRRMNFFCSQYCKHNHGKCKNKAVS